ncbi:FHA domain-containing protein [Georgenia sp. MJ206]|uniref:FHA domain-containing protein n=1 Tax=Georgenia wangjunii TaxID=3117730 RepID=UPI002F25F4EC
MNVIPEAARPWLPVESRNRPWATHGSMMVRRAEALGVLDDALNARPRLAAGAGAWVLGLVGAFLLGRWVAALDDPSGGGSLLLVLAGVALVGAVAVGAVVVHAGSRLVRAQAAWLTLATDVRADGARVRDGALDPETERLHERVRAHDRSPAGSPRASMVRVAGAVVAVLGTIALLGAAIAGRSEAQAPYATSADVGPWVALVAASVVTLVVALALTAGLRRVRRARTHRVNHPEHDGGSPAPGRGAGATSAAAPGGRPGAPAIIESAPTWGQAGAGTASPASPASPAGPTGASAGPQAPAPTAPTAPPARPVLPAPTSTPPAADPGLSATPAPAAQAPAASAPTAPVTPAVVPPVFDAPVEAPPVAPPTVRLDDGRVLGAGTTLLGRAPRAHGDERVDALLAVDDQAVSKTHLTIEIDGRGIRVTDRGSTNGTRLARAGEQSPCEPWRAVTVGDGDQVLVGSTVITVGDLPEQDVERTIMRDGLR